MIRRLLWRLLEVFGIVRGVVRAVHEPPPAERDDDGVDPRRRETPSSPRTELALVALLGLAGLGFVAFAVLIAADADPRLLGVALGGGLAALAAGLVVAGLRVVPQEVAVEERPPLGDPAARAEAAKQLGQAADGVSRRRLIAAAAGAAGTGLAAAAVLPITALGPGAHVLDESPWRAGVALVDEDGAPVTADAVPIGSFVTAFPAGADRRELGAPVVVVHVDPLTLELPAARRSWAPEGLLAYSKICTHAGCAVSLFRHPLNEDTSGPPALVCPCHYSTFDVRRAAKVTLGPAGRPLPQLPLRLDAQRRLVAGGPLSGSVGPAWWGTERA
jgi:ubiquinol-cytochrome c reductase iron-sulfur subunit